MFYGYPLGGGDTRAEYLDLVGVRDAPDSVIVVNVRALDVLAPSARPQPRAFSPQLSYETLLSRCACLCRPTSPGPSSAEAMTPAAFEKTLS